MACIDHSGLKIDQLVELVGKVQAEMASHEKQRRRDGRGELKHRIAAEGYWMGDIFRKFVKGAADARQSRKMSGKFGNPENTDETWTAIARSRKWIQAILIARGIEISALRDTPMYRISG